MKTAMISFSSLRRGGFPSREVIAEGINKRILENSSVLVQRAAYRGKHLWPGPNAAQLVRPNHGGVVAWD